ncbi:MAG: phosphatase PAP2 family protein [Mycobacteriales bacterium]
MHLLVPLAPLRMMPGFVDIGVLFGQSVYDGSLGGAANQIAAMPSLHLGWAVLVAVGTLATLRTRWRWLIVAHPPITLLVVVVTANHCWLDALVAVALLAVVLRVFAPRPLRRLPWLAQDRAACGGPVADPDREDHPQPCPKQHGPPEPSASSTVPACETTPVRPSWVMVGSVRHVVR